MVLDTMIAAALPTAAAFSRFPPIHLLAKCSFTMPFASWNQPTTPSQSFGCKSRQRCEFRSIRSCALPLSHRQGSCFKISGCFGWPTFRDSRP